jgi:hypothetical protein
VGRLAAGLAPAIIFDNMQWVVVVGGGISGLGIVITLALLVVDWMFGSAQGAARKVHPADGSAAQVRSRSSPRRPCHWCSQVLWSGWRAVPCRAQRQRRAASAPQD